MPLTIHNELMSKAVAVAVLSILVPRNDQISPGPQQLSLAGNVFKELLPFLLLSSSQSKLPFKVNGDDEGRGQDLEEGRRAITAVKD